MSEQLPFELNRPYGFYGVDNNTFKIGKLVIEVLEDEDDGYRSYLGSIELRSAEGKIFFKRALDTVRVVEDEEGDFDGYKLVGTDGHVWLRFGTDNSCEYYPWFTFEYTPRPR